MKDINEFQRIQIDGSVKLNPAIVVLRQIFSNYNRMLKIEELSGNDIHIKDGYFISSVESIFHSGEIDFELNYSSNGDKKTIHKRIQIKEYPVSPFDTLIAFAQISNMGGFLKFPTRAGDLKQKPDDILFFKSANHTSFIFLESGIYYTSSQKLKDIWEFMKDNKCFELIKPSYIVNLSKVDLTDGKKAFLYRNREPDLKDKIRKDIEMARGDNKIGYFDFLFTYNLPVQHFKIPIKKEDQERVMQRYQNIALEG